MKRKAIGFALISIIIFLMVMVLLQPVTSPDNLDELLQAHGYFEKGSTPICIIEREGAILCAFIDTDSKIATLSIATGKNILGRDYYYLTIKEVTSVHFIQGRRNRGENSNQRTSLADGSVVEWNVFAEGEEAERDAFGGVEVVYEVLKEKYWFTYRFVE